MGMFDGVADKLSGLFGKKKDDSSGVPRVGRVQRAPADDPAVVDANDYNDYDDNVSRLFSDDDNADDGDSDVVVNEADDILALLRIEPNIPVPRDVLMPDNLMELSFTLTEPVGYSAKQVDEFVNTVNHALSWYIQALQERNKNVADLANQITKTERSMNRLKLDQELSSDGISVSSGDVRDDSQLMQLQYQLMNEKDENERLRKQLASAGGGTVLIDDEQSSLEKKYSDLQDQLAILQKKYQNLQEANRRLKLRVADDDEQGIRVNGALGDSIFEASSDTDEDSMSLPTLGTDDGDGMSLPTPDIGGAAPEESTTKRRPKDRDASKRIHKRPTHHGDSPAGSRRKNRRDTQSLGLPDIPDMDGSNDFDMMDDSHESSPFIGDDDISLPDGLMNDKQYDDISDDFGSDEDISFDFTD